MTGRLSIKWDVSTIAFQGYAVHLKSLGLKRCHYENVVAGGSAPFLHS